MEKNEKIILFQGDSITDGGRMRGKENEWDLNHQMGHDYAFLINSVLGTKYPGENLRFYNRGLSGNRISDLYGRWVEDCLALNPDVLSIMVGINDCGFNLKDGTGSSPERFEKIYQLLLDEAKENNPKIKLVLCEPFTLPSGVRRADYEEWKREVEPLQEKTRILAQRNGAVFVPLQEMFFELLKEREAEYWIWDGVHPTVCGHQMIADQWLKYAEEIWRDI